MSRAALALAALAACAPTTAAAELHAGPPRTTTSAPEHTSSTSPAPPPATTAPAPTTNGTGATSQSSMAALLACLRRYESGDGAASPNLYQFEGPTWASIGGHGRAGDASRAEQDARAQALIERDGVARHWAAQRGRCF